MVTQIPINTYRLLYLLLGIVYLFGLGVPLMNNDAAHHANIALNMYKTGNYAFLIDSGMPYLDKPHLLFWLSALSYHVFGVTALAYKIPSLLFTVLGTFSTYKLGTLLYDKATGRLAALILASSFAYVLANNDVRMDAILTASIIFATWHLVGYVKYKKTASFVLAALGLALGFATKGWVGAVVPAVALFFYLAYRGQWKAILNPRWLLLIALFFVFISPVLYAYYLQFDLHPETAVRGRDHISGIRFILWDQNFERMAGESFGSTRANDHFFFLHSLMWAFLPWSLLVLGAFYWHIRSFFRGYSPGLKRELLTPATLLFFLLLFSISKFKLPHYLNMLFPYFAILLAGYLNQHSADSKYHGWFKGIQLFVLLVMGLVVLVINGWLFPVSGIWVIVLAVGLLVIAGMVTGRRSHPYQFSLVASVGFTAVLYFLLNANFYPKLLKYQGGSELAKEQGHRIAVSQLRYLGEGYREFAFYFYMKTLPVATTIDDLLLRTRQGETTWMLVNEDALQQIEQANLKIKERYLHQNFHITRLKPAFLNPRTRDMACDTLQLIRL